MPVPTLTSGPDWTFAQAGVTVDVLLEAVASGSAYHTQSQNCCVQLSDGTGVTLVAFGGYYFLLGTQAGKTAIQVLGSATAGDTTNGAYALAVDTATPQNLYVVRGLSGGTMYLWKWVKDTGNNSWSVGAAGTCTDSVAENTAMNAIWVNDGGGYLLVTTENSVLTFSTTFAPSMSPTDSHTLEGPAALTASGAGVGATSGLLIQSGGPNQTPTANVVRAATWSSSGGSLTLSAWTTIDPQTAGGPNDDVNFSPHVRYAGGSPETWFVLYPDQSDNLIAQAVNSSLAFSGRVPAPTLAGVAHYVPNGRGAEVGTYAEFNFNTSSYVWVVTRAPGNAALLQRQLVKMTTGGSPFPTWDLLAFTVANGMDNSSTSVVCPGEPYITQVDVVIGSVPGAVTTYLVSGTAVDPVYQPAAPVLTGPNYGAVNDNLTHTIPFEFTVDPDEDQYAFALVTVPWGGGSARYWTGTEWTQFEFRLFPTSPPIPAGQGPALIDVPTVGTGQFVGNGAAYGWYILTWDNAQICSLQPFPRKLVIAVSPSVVTSPPSVSTSAPAISWAYTPGTSGAGQASYRVIIVEHLGDPTVPADIVVDSGTIPGPAASWPNMADPWPSANDYLINGQGYDVYVFVTDVLGATNGPLGTGMYHVSWTVSYSAPTTPVLTATAPTDGSYATLSATGTDGDQMELQYSYDNATWADVRGSPLVVAGGVAVAQDYDLVGNSTGGLFTATIYYRARQVAAGEQVSAWSTVESIIVPAWLLYWWLKDPLTPAKNAQVQVKPPWDLPIKVVAASYTELGASVDVVVSDGARGPTGELTFITVDPSTDSGGDYANLLALLLPALVPATGLPRTLLLQGPFGDSYYMTFTDTDDISTEFTPADVPLRETKLKYVNVARP